MRYYQPETPALTYQIIRMDNSFVLIACQVRAARLEIGSREMEGQSTRQSDEQRRAPGHGPCVAQFDASDLVASRQIARFCIGTDMVIVAYLLT